MSHEITLKSETDRNKGMRPTTVLGIDNIQSQKT